jgi:PIN domain nuclease of toxin-antitoxin system
MRVLLDTQVYLWWLRDDRRLGAEAREPIGDAGSTVYVSAASIWEAGIKAALGRLDVGDADLVDEIGANGFLPLAIDVEDAALAATLPRHHDDPFDRMLIAQAVSDGLVLITSDAQFERYDVALLRT